MHHSFTLDLRWQGDRGTGTSGYRDYGREHLVSAGGKPSIPTSAARAFFGDDSRWNPEELLLAALAQCHALAFLRVATRDGVVVVGYRDAPRAELETSRDGSGAIVRAALRPRVDFADPGDAAHASRLHADAADLCFIARSVAFPVSVEPNLEP